MSKKAKTRKVEEKSFNEFPFIITAANYKGNCDNVTSSELPEYSLQRLSVYVDTKKELDKKLRDIPGGNTAVINKLYKSFDEAIKNELILAKKLIS